MVDVLFSETVTIFLAPATTISNWRVCLIPVNFSLILPHSGLTTLLSPQVSGSAPDPAGSRSFGAITSVKNVVTGEDLVTAANAVAEYSIFLCFQKTSSEH